MIAAAGLLLLPPHPATTAAQTTSKTLLPNGLTVLVKEQPVTDLVVVEVLARAGPRMEEAAEAGISPFLLGTVLRGTVRRTAVEIALAVEEIGGILRATTSTDYIELATITPLRSLDTAVDLLADLTTGATFSVDAIETQRPISLSRVRQQADQPLTRALDLAAGHLFPFHPYGQPVTGTITTVSAITQDRLVAFYRTIFTGPNMVVVVAGKVKTPDVLDKVQRAFGAVRNDLLPRRLRLLPRVEQAIAPRPSELREAREVRQTAAAWIAMSYLGVGITHRDWAPLRVLSGILGDGLSSRLFVEIREKRGLAYQVGAFFPTRAGPSPFTLFAGTDPKTLPQVTEGLAREVARVRDAPPNAEELDLAKQRIIGSHIIDHEDLQRQAFLLGWYELLGVGFVFDSRLPQFIAAVTAEDVQRAARVYLQIPTIAVVLPPAK